MQMIDNIVIISLIVLAFVAGKTISDRYHEKIIAELEFMLRRTDIEKGIGYVPPVQRTYNPIGTEFMDRLKKNGHATQALRHTSN